MEDSYEETNHRDCSIGKYRTKSYWMLPGYMKGIEQAGGIPLMIPLTSNEENLQQLADEIDGFLYTGG